MILVLITSYGYIVVAVASIVGFVIAEQEGNCKNIWKIYFGNLLFDGYVTTFLTFLSL